MRSKGRQDVYSLRVESQNSQIDRILLISVGLLLVVGLVMVYSSSNAVSHEHRGDSYHFLKMQALWCCIGIAAMVLVTFFNYSYYQRLVWLMLGVSIALLLLIYFPGVGVTRGGSTRWIRVWRYTFQPAELAKLVLVIYMAGYLTRNSDCIRSFWRGILPGLVVLSVLSAMIYRQPDLGSVVLIGAVVFIMLFVGGARIYQMVLMGIAAGLLLIVMIWLEPYRWERLMTFLNPWRDPEGSGYHIMQSFYALGSGGVLGTGLGAGMQKLHYLPVPHSDFIFAVIGEELGFVGALFIIALFMVIVWRGMQISLSTEDQFGSLLAAGITSLIGIQAAINIGVVVGALPTKGLTLPFISFGGSSMLVSLMSVGILMNISKERSTTASD